MLLQDDGLWADAISYVSGSWEMENDFFNALLLVDIHVNPMFAANEEFAFDPTRIMYQLGSALGLDGIEDGIDTEIMSWNGWVEISHWPASLPPITLISSLIILLALWPDKRSK